MEAITTHENADFDAMASLLGAAKLYPGARAVLPRRLNQNVRDFLTIYGGDLPFMAASDLPEETLSRLLLVDVSSVPPLKGVGPATTVETIDHHGPPEGQTGANTTLLVERIREGKLPLSPIEATLLLTGIYEDTGNLTYSTTTPRDLGAAAWLLENGASLEVAGDFLTSPLTPLQRELYQKLLEGSELLSFSGHTVLVSGARSAEYVAEVSALAHLLGELYDPAALFVLVEMGRSVQVVARSSTEAIDVGAIARALGGGGHPKAAAAFLEGAGLAEAKARLLGLLPGYIRPSLTVGEIMSWGVHVLSPQTTVREAEEAMRRYGHEGFPVVEDGRLAGVLTRREIDRALQHRLHDRPIELYMHKGEISVSPGDSVERLRRLMLEHGLGQIPVVEGGEVVGIVTRTDLIRLWSGKEQVPKGRVLEKLRSALPAELQALLVEVGRKADSLGLSAYLVGGFVRDLLLGYPNLDIDLVVEGDAVSLAEALASERGGRLHRHPRFGTATWWPSLASAGTESIHLDFTTARTEFYPHPTALPQVERSSIRQDLGRRDFTINTLAISLGRARFGELLDFYGAQKDLGEGLIRVLHNLSFIEDPTRILRAVRLAERLGFRIEERTAELLRGGIGHLDGVSGERIRQELHLIFQEKKRAGCLGRLEELGVLGRISPGLSYDAWAEERLMVLAGLGEEAGIPPQGGIEMGCLGVLSFRLGGAELSALVRRLGLSRAESRVLEELGELRILEGRLSPAELAPSQLYYLLRGKSSESLFLFWLGSAEPRARERVASYFRVLRHTRLSVDGHHLRALGLKPGPAFRAILERLLQARLDGEVCTEGEERALAQRLVRDNLADKKQAMPGQRKAGDSLR